MSSTANRGDPMAHHASITIWITTIAVVLTAGAHAGSIQQAVEARAAAIRRARADARAGDIFTADVRVAFFSRILRANELCGDLAPDVPGEADEGGEGWEPPVVNGRFSWGTATLTSPCVLAALPELPQELQYRFLGREGRQALRV
jgi:hypothetical protein